MSERRQIGLAVIGCGTIGRIRAVLAREYPGVGWLGLCDVNAELGRRLYDHLVRSARAQHPVVHTGEFGADMQVSLVNDGPVTIPMRM